MPFRSRRRAAKQNINYSESARVPQVVEVHTPLGTQVGKILTRSSGRTPTNIEVPLPAKKRKQQTASSVAATEKDQPTNEAIDSGEKDGEEHKSKDEVAQSTTAPLAVASKGKEVSSACFGNL